MLYFFQMIKIIGESAECEVPVTARVIDVQENPQKCRNLHKMDFTTLPCGEIFPF